MQRHLLTSGSKKTEANIQPSLDVALTKPDDVELFYTASVQFLQKRLQEKSLVAPTKSQRNTKSCCNLSSSSNSQRVIDKHTALSMHEILPFPKSNGESFFSRILNSFRKFSTQIIPDSNTEDLEMVNTRSNYKFPRCEKDNKGHSSYLNVISEDEAREAEVVPSEQDVNSTHNDGKYFQQSLKAVKR
ncbi:unnamed protein product, partial [Brenthis ino]